MLIVVKKYHETMKNESDIEEDLSLQTYCSVSSVFIRIRRHFSFFLSFLALPLLGKDWAAVMKQRPSVGKCSQLTFPLGRASRFDSCQQQQINDHFPALLLLTVKGEHCILQLARGEYWLRSEHRISVGLYTVYNSNKSSFNNAL